MPCNYIRKKNILENLNDKLNLISFIIALNKQRGFFFLSLHIFMQYSLWQFKDTSLRSLNHWPLYNYPVYQREGG